MPSITNVGGSFTSAIVLTLLAWTVRWVRARASARPNRQLDAPHHDDEQTVETVPIPHILIDIRSNDERKQHPLPTELHAAAHIEAHMLGPALASDLAWRERLSSTKHTDDATWPAHPASPKVSPRGVVRPHPSTMLVLLTDDVAEGHVAAAAAALKGYHTTALISGGLGAWRSTPGDTPPRLATPQLRFLSRDAVAVLFGAAGETKMHRHAAALDEPRHSDFTIPAHPGVVRSRFVPRGLPAPPKVTGAEQGTAEGPLLIDVRRHDERALYGSIPQSVHVPVEQLASALELPAAEFSARYGFPKPSADTVVVLHCRTNRRSSWAAVLGADAGLRRCYVYSQGTYGWRLSPDVAVYAGYEVTDPPPEPEECVVERIDAAAGRTQCDNLALDMRTSPHQPSEF